jgi:hypothetical protein
MQSSSFEFKGGFFLPLRSATKRRKPWRRDEIGRAQELEMAVPDPLKFPTMPRGETPGH